MPEKTELFISYLKKIEKIDNEIRELRNESLIFFPKYSEHYKRQIEVLKHRKKKLIKEYEYIT